MYSLLPLISLLPAVLGAPTTTWWKPTKSNTFLYDIDRVPVPAPTVTTNTGLKLNKNVYIVDMAGHTAADIQKYKNAGKKVVCYLSAGSWEPFRDDKLKFDPACYCGSGKPYDKTTGQCSSSYNQLDGWDEWWLDIRSSKCLANVKPIMAARIKQAKDKGCDGIDPDNMDSYGNEQHYGTLAQDQVNYLSWFAEAVHNQSMAVGLKNAGNLLADWNDDGLYNTKWQSQLVKAFDFNVIESCNEYTECVIYKSMLDAGKPQIQVEYNSNTTVCPAKVSGITLSVYSGDVLNSTQINLDC